MTGEAHWLEPTLVILGGLGVFVLLQLAVRTGNSLLVEWRQFKCPVRHLRVNAKLVDDLARGQYRDLKYCSAWGRFGKPCDKKCLAGLNDHSIRAI